MKTIMTILLVIGAMRFGVSQLHAQDNATPERDLVVLVNATTKVDSMNEAELSRALRGKDNRFELVGLQKQSYGHILKELAKTDDGNFQREWLQLLLIGKRKKKPFISENPIELAAFVSKNPHAIAVLHWENLNKTPAALGLKVVKIFKKK